MKRSKFFDSLTIAVAGGLTVKDAASVAGCTIATAYTLSCSDDFKREVSRLKSEAVAMAIAVLSANATKASQALIKLLDSDDEKIILASATKILSMLGPLTELHELRDRIDAIENQKLRIAT